MSGYLVLIVEDNEHNLKLSRDVLSFKGFRTLEARTAAECLELARTETPDLILMDVQLPDQDGISALKELRAAAATNSIPVVAVTAFAMKGDEERLMDAGFDGYIPKPINVRSFADEVSAFLQEASP